MNEDKSYENEIALIEANLASIMDDYFRARPFDVSACLARVFESAFISGWKAKCRDLEGENEGNI